MARYGFRLMRWPASWFDKLAMGTHTNLILSASKDEADEPRIDLSDIFQEVEEDVRRERYEQIWKDYGNYIMVAAALLVLAVAGYQAWRNYDLSQRQKTSDQYRVAMQSAQTGNAPKAE